MMQPQEFNFGEHALCAGVDEVGRGPLVGDVVAAAVILDPNQPIEGLMDSKKLSEKRRESLSIEIKERALCWSIAVATPQEIDELNILHATMLAMKRAVLGLSQVPDHVYVDGNRCPEIPYSVEAVVKGDSKVAEISAASIIAKVHRDHQMLELDAQFPQYQFAKHKGYPTPAHLQLIKEYGVLPEYRRSFAPVRRLLEEKGQNV
jgi:ribonuclease HII